jgi:hypothetical protein
MTEPKPEPTRQEQVRQPKPKVDPRQREREDIAELTDFERQLLTKELHGNPTDDRPRYGRPG